MYITNADQDEMNTAQPYRALTFDPALFEAYLDHPDIGEDDRRQYLEALWAIMCLFVDFGYDIQPAQTAIPADLETITAPTNPAEQEES